MPFSPTTKRIDADTGDDLQSVSAKRDGVELEYRVKLVSSEIMCRIVLEIY
jgi:hypothetical protein